MVADPYKSILFYKHYSSFAQFPALLDQYIERGRKMKPINLHTNVVIVFGS